MKRLVTRLTLVLSLALAGALLVGACGCQDLGQAEDTTTTDGSVMEATGSTDGAQSTSTSGTTSTTSAVTSTTLPPAATTTSTTAGMGILIDPVVIALPTRYEDDDPALQWVGTWSTASSTAHSDGTAKFSGTPNSRVGIQFEGTGVRLIAPTPGVAGRITVHLYGAGADITDTIDLTGSGETKVAVWSSGTIPSGTYQCWFGYDPTNIPGRYIWVDAIDIWPPTPPAT